MPLSILMKLIKLTHDLLECLYSDRFERIEDMNKLQQLVEDAVKSKRLLLDGNHNTSRLDTLLAPLWTNSRIGK
jgi:hypothetical protein